MFFLIFLFTFHFFHFSDLWFSVLPLATSFLVNFVSPVLLLNNTDATNFATIFCAHDTEANAMHNPFYWELWPAIIPDCAS